MSPRRTVLFLAALGIVLAIVVPVLAATPKKGRYTPRCPQGYMHVCGEAGWNVSHAGHQIDKNSLAPWPNDPADPGRGICKRGNPYSPKAIPIKNGKFSYTGVAVGKKFTWKGAWVTAKKVKGTVKWAGCSTLVNYTATTP